MIVHIALFKWKKGVSKQKIEKSMEDIKKLKNKVDGLIDIVAGENFSKYSEGFTHAVVVLAKDRGALQAYRGHPLHIIVAKEIEKMEERGIGFDFED